MPNLKFSKALEGFGGEIRVVSKLKNHKIIKTSPLRKLIQEDFSPNNEHDSHEFLLYFLNNLNEELIEKGTKLPTDAKLDLTDLWY